MRILSLLSVLALAGCTDNGSETDTDDPGTGTADACTTGETQVTTTACGFNGRGVLSEDCVDGQWEDGDCADPDVCVDGVPSSESCWDGRGARVLDCVDGDYVASDCTLLATTRVSVSSEGFQADADSDWPSVSDDGRYIVYLSSASTLIEAGGGRYNLVYLHDLETQTTTMVSLSDAGYYPNKDCRQAQISADGRFIVYTTNAANLVSEDTNWTGDVFLYDRTAETTIRVSVTSTGEQIPANNYDPQMTSDGRYVFFASTGIVMPDDTDDRSIYRYDTQDGSVIRVSALGASSDSFVISSDGAWMALAAAEGVDGFLPSPPYHVWLMEVATGVRTQVTVSTTGADPNSYSVPHGISDDGRFVSFHSDASDLIEGDTNDQVDIFLYDHTTGTVTREGVSPAGEQLELARAWYPKLSASGTVLAFESWTPEVVAEDPSNGAADIFIRDLTTDSTHLITQDAAGQSVIGGGAHPFLSRNGHHVVYVSGATTLVDGEDLGGFVDIFVSPTGL